MKYDQIEKLLKTAHIGPSKWELDTIIYHDRTTNPSTLISFFNRIINLKSVQNPSALETAELKKLLELLADLDQKECNELLSNSDNDAKDHFIESLARNSAIEILTKGRLDKETMETACKLSPSDFILCAKRTQDLINAIQGLVIKGENLSNDVAGA